MVETAQGNIRLFGYMEPLFGDENQIIEWRFANIRIVIAFVHGFIISSTGDKRERTATTHYRFKDKDLTLKQ